MEIQINNKNVEIIQGDITEQETKAVVNAANNHLWMGSGVAGAIKKKGGQQIEANAIKQGPINIGEAVITEAGDLKAEYVIHAASMGQDLKTNTDYIGRATLAALKLAEKYSLTSISLPAIGAGTGGVEVHQCASVMLNQTIEFLQSSESVNHVRFVLFDDNTEQAFNDELRHMFERH
ncbi:MAG: macro domain-containing protein [Candidatus Marinimicrobia bacterium]|nr:macro domain-containing protein [Candidatus Neomarinimicrobiota bacterium]MCF7829854.1 macro domain-containing protein [Candidatus Neomarinimicrobiota bacterium]MCF7882482.1 macro domain-containing protein [Candidatus Neomarinimicrobiota bacterium]